MFLKNLAQLTVLLQIIFLGACVLSENQNDRNYVNIPETKTRSGSDFEAGAAYRLGGSTGAVSNGQETEARNILGQSHGLVIPDGSGNYMIMPGKNAYEPNANYVNARELKLKMRELASQLVGNMDGSLKGMVALPTTFVSQEDFERTSAFGRFVAEQMYYEFNQRGLPTHEYRISGQLYAGADGEFILKRGTGESKLDSKNLYLVGTYYTDGKSIFVNARLIRSNGQVIRTGQLVLVNNNLTKRMLASSGKKLPEGQMQMMDFETEARPPSNKTAFDEGMDIH